MSKPRKKKRAPKRILALPDLEQSKAAVLNSLTSKSGQHSYDHAITDFVEWYCSEPRLAFNRTLALRYRIFLEQKPYAPTTINLRLAAVRRVAFEAADPSGPTSGQLRVMRGGSWGNSPKDVRVSVRFSRPPAIGFNFRGFRSDGPRLPLRSALNRRAQPDGPHQPGHQ